MAKTLLKLCPNCDTKKKGRERFCTECGYDFEKNKIYNVENDIRITNFEIRKYLRQQKNKQIMNTAFVAVTMLSLAGVITYYVLTDKE